MTAAELYACDLTTKCLIDLWVKERRCPLPLVDRMLEMGLERQADAALWAATEPERAVFVRGERMGSSYPYPARYTEDHFYWYTYNEAFWAIHRNGDYLACWNLPESLWPITNAIIRHHTAADALLWLMDSKLPLKTLTDATASDVNCQFKWENPNPFY